MSDIPDEAVEAIWAAVEADSVLAANLGPYLDDADLEAILTAAAPIIRADELSRVIAEIQASNLGAPLQLNQDGTARFLTGPELRENICAFISAGLDIAARIAEGDQE